MEQCLAHGECCLHQPFFLLQVFALSLSQQMVPMRAEAQEEKVSHLRTLCKPRPC